MTTHIITWDLGATKCTAGLIEYSPTSHALTCKQHFTLKLAQTRSLEHLIHDLEAGLGARMSEVDAVCIGAAGHYDGQTLLHTNPYPFPMDFADTAKQQHWPPFAIIHDYASIVCSTFTSYMDQDRNIKRLNECAIQPYGRRVAFGMGTGLGLKDGVLFANGDFWLGHNEAGHIGITTPPNAERQHLLRHKEIMQFLQTKLAHKTSSPITFEELLTGKGIVNLYQFFHPDCQAITPEEVGKKIQLGKASETLEAFAWYIGLFVGTIQLIFMPEGGIWITGGVAMTHVDVFDQPDFFAGIHATPAYRTQREQYALGVLCNHEHALIGSGYYAAKRLL